MQPGFLLDPEVAYLNHGSFGACSQAVFDEYQRIQRELEREPTDFFVRQGGADGKRLDGARSALAAFVGAEAKDLVFVPNATSGLNAVIRSLALAAEDEVLTTAHEYGAITLTWNFVGAKTIVCEPDEIAGRIGPRTRAVCFSHITSPTSLVLPVEEICAAARAAGVLSIVDGAHVPGHIPLDLGSLGADLYAGNCHEWLCAPKGSGFLWARPEHHGWIEPLVVSWGYGDDSDFGERHGWQGTRDPAAYLAVPAAIDLHATFDLERGRTLADLVESRLGERDFVRIPGIAAPFMRSIELPPGEPAELRERLYGEFRVEVPVFEWEGRRVPRISIGPYNDEDDVERLVAALDRLL